MAVSRHPDIHLALSQQRRVILYGASFVSRSQGAGIDQPVYAGYDTLFSVRPDCGHVYDFIFSLSRPLSFRTFEAGQVA